MAIQLRAPNVSVRGGTATKGGTRFSAQISTWVNKTKQRIDLVQKVATFKLVQVMQTTVHQGGNLPFREGYLQASLTVTYGNETPRGNRRKINSSRFYNENAVRTKIFAAEPGQRIRLSYTMAYARVLEYTGVHAGFVMRSVQRWPAIFAASVQEVKGMVK